MCTSDLRQPDELEGALTAAGIAYTDATVPNTVGTDRRARRTLRVEADTELVGHLAQQAGVALIELRDADGAGLEEMFLELTADTQRERTAA